MTRELTAFILHFALITFHFALFSFRHRKGSPANRAKPDFRVP